MVTHADIRRLALAQIDEDELPDLLRGAWRLQAPKVLQGLPPD